jgi:hypothetical protein
MPGAPLSPALVHQLQRTAGNRATTHLVLQRHQIDTPPGELDELETVVQRLTGPQVAEANSKVDTAITAAAGVDKARNPILHNTGKALTKGDLRKSVHNTDDADKKAWVAGSAKTTVNLGGRWVLDHPTNEIQGALAHEVAHILGGGGLDEYQDEFNAYWAEVNATKAAKRTPDEMQEKLSVIRGVIAKYGWWTTASAEKREEWKTVSAAAGFNLSNSWKQKKLLDLMSSAAPAGAVTALVKKMNKVDRGEARSAKKPNGSFYLNWSGYPEADKITIWKALGGDGQAP